MRHRIRCSVVVALVLLSACGQPEIPTPVADPEPTPTPSAAPTLSITDLGDFGPPGFTAGGLGLWTKKKYFTVYESSDLAAPSMRLKAFNPNGQVLRLLVLEAREEPDGTSWFKVLLPDRPNGSTGWIRSDPESFRLDQLPDRIEVDLSEYRLEHYRDGELRNRFEVGIGEDRYPTPTGVFYLWASVPQPDPAGPYGRFALGLSGFSPVLSDWPGGGRSAIHGTADESDRGAKVSHGCVRVFNKDMRTLERLPLGTPVLISE